MARSLMPQSLPSECPSHDDNRDSPATLELGESFAHDRLGAEVRAPGAIRAGNEPPASAGLGEHGVGVVVHGGEPISAALPTARTPTGAPARCRSSWGMQHIEIGTNGSSWSGIDRIRLNATHDGAEGQYHRANERRPG